MEKTREQLEREYIDSYYDSDIREESLRRVGCMIVLIPILAALVGFSLLLIKWIN